MRRENSHQMKLIWCMGETTAGAGIVMTCVDYADSALCIKTK